MPDLKNGSEIRSTASFAALLGSLTGSSKKGETWDDSALLDDVATISYEQALRSHRRVPPVIPPPESQRRSIGVPDLAQEQAHVAAKEKKRKSASITIRLTEPEERQLHERAAAAGLTVSAYLRSCIFEAEELRTQVRQALAQMQTPLPSIATSANADERPRIWSSRFLSSLSRRKKSER